MLKISIHIIPFFDALCTVEYLYIIMRVHVRFSLVESCALLEYTTTGDVIRKRYIRKQNIFSGFSLPRLFKRFYYIKQIHVIFLGSVI